MVNPFIIDNVIDKIKKVFDIDIVFANLDKKKVEWIFYKYQTNDFHDLDNEIIIIDLLKGESQLRREFNMNELFYYKGDLFEVYIKRLAHEFLDFIYDGKQQFTLIKQVPDFKCF